jgi:beta-galactosidase
MNRYLLIGGFACILAVSGASAASPSPAAADHTFAIGEEHFLLDGKPYQIRCGELHFARVPREYWRHRLQMCKAMGLNTVCAYLFWNFHERTPGEFTWSGAADAAAFCRMAQEEGLWVILRPGPYACAEWTMGGLPWWLLKHEDIRLRSTDPRFIEASRRYLHEVGRVLGPLQVTQGGPILMVQVENEHGFYGDDPEYMGVLRQVMLDAGFDVPLFSCNPVWHLQRSHNPDLFPVVNFGSDPAAGFEALRRILPTGPLMCGEFYSGWFNTWGNPHHPGDTGPYLRDLEYMLQRGASFSIYMAHGGTTFGLWAGADRPFKPDTSSYDYGAPISEAGWVTDKFRETRALFARYLQEGESLPEPPAPNPVIAIPEAAARAWAPVFANLPAAREVDLPGTFEAYDQADGCILYRTTLPLGPVSTLEAAEVKDAAWVFLDGEQIGVFDRRSRQFSARVPAREAAATLDILVEAMGRVNFGEEVHDRKGLHSPVTLTAHGGGEAHPLTGWQLYNLPLDAPMLAGLDYQDAPATPPKTPAFWRATLQVAEPGDTFLDVRNWGKGVAWINGRCLGRFWNIGPTQTMYVPGPWLQTGANELVLLDLLGPQSPTAAGLTQPIMDQLRPELDFAAIRKARTLQLEGKNPLHRAAFAPGAAMQTVTFPTAGQGRHVALEMLDSHNDQPYAAIAELDLLDEDGNIIPHNLWTIAYVSSEERVQEDGTAENAIDGQTSNIWHSEWGAAQPDYPHTLVIDLGESRTISGLRYVPRADRENGRIKEYRVYVGNALVGD